MGAATAARLSVTTTDDDRAAAFRITRIGARPRAVESVLETGWTG
jgi:hypothetical protein